MPGPDAVPDRLPAAERRVSDTDRDHAARRLSDACAAGMLRVDELGERLDRAYAATTAGELAALTSDLPSRRPRRVRRRHGCGSSRAYLPVMALLVAIWLVTAITAGAWYPWPIWPALGWGLPLLAGRNSPRRLTAGAGD